MSALLRLRRASSSDLVHVFLLFAVGLFQAVDLRQT